MQKLIISSVPIMQSDIVVSTTVTTITVRINLITCTKMTLNLVTLTKRINVCEPHTDLDVSFFIFCKEDVTTEIFYICASCKGTHNRHSNLSKCHSN